MSDDRSDREWTPIEDRRRFLAALGSAGAAAFAGCSSGGDGNGDDNSGAGGNGNGSGGNGDGNGGNGDGNGNGGNGNDGNGSSGDGGDGTDDPGTTETVAPEDNPVMPEERKSFVAPSGAASTTFDATFSDGTVYVGGDTIEAVVDADMENQRYVIDETTLGRELAEGDVVVISGVAMRKVTGVQRSGSEATIETEQATMDEAIAEGTVGWDAEVGFDTAHAAESATQSESAGSIEPPADGLDGAPAIGTNVGENVYFAGVEMQGERGEAIGYPDITVTEQGLKWEFSEGGLDYIFEITAAGEEATVTVTVQKVVGGNAKMALVAEGTVGKAKSVANAEYSDEELQAMDLQNDDVGGEITLDVQAAGAGKGSIDWEFPGFMFKYVVMAGPVPVTIGYAPQIVGKYVVPVEGSATATATFSFNSAIGFEYTGTDTDVDATVGEQSIDPEPADSAANIGSAVDLQFGLAFPRLTVSVFEQGIIPYIHTGVTVGSRLTWGPLCKSSYVRFVVQAGYDFEMMGVSFASDKETLYEDRQEAKGDSCED